MRSLSAALLAFFVGVVVAPPALADTLQGKVVDGEGKPVAGATAAMAWFEGGAGRAQVSDEGGRFSMDATIGGRPFPVFVMDAARKQGALHLYTKDDADQEKTFRLAPLVRVHGSLTCKALGSAAPALATIYVKAPGGAMLHRVMTRDGHFSVLLPRGTFEIEAQGRDVRTKRIKREILGNEGALDLGAVDLDPTPIARLYGKEFPAWHVTDAHGIDKGVQVADFKGKWLVLDFWFTTCAPCVHGALPLLMDFDEEFADRRDEFAIVTMHTKDIKTAADMGAALAELRDGPWKGRALPFPVLLDGTGKTIRSLGIRLYPTMVVVDPQGRVVRHGDLDTVRDALLRTDKRVIEDMAVLRRAVPDPKAFAQAVLDLAKRGDKYAAFALYDLIYRELEAPTAKQIDVVTRAIPRAYGPHVVRFFLGVYGARSPDKARRIEAAKTLRAVGERQTLFELVRVISTERDPDVKGALNDTIKAINAR